MTYLVQVDEDVCAAHGDCVEVAPEVFSVNGVAQVIGTGPDDLLLEAAESCPSTAIMLFDQASGEQVFP